MTETRGEAIASARDRAASKVAGGRKAPGPGLGMERSQRPAWAVRSRITTGRGVGAAGGLGQVQRERVVGAEHPAAALQGVLAQGVGRLRLAQLVQGLSQGGRR